MADYDVLRMLTTEDLQDIFHFSYPQALNLMKSTGFPSTRLNNQWRVQAGKLQSWQEQQAGRAYNFFMTSFTGLASIPTNPADGFDYKVFKAKIEK